eukprot:4622651-Amphidinium_carterae.1
MDLRSAVLLATTHGGIAHGCALQQLCYTQFHLYRARVPPTPHPKPQTIRHCNQETLVNMSLCQNAHIEEHKEKPKRLKKSTQITNAMT